MDKMAEISAGPTYSLRLVQERRIHVLKSVVKSRRFIP